MVLESFNHGFDALRDTVDLHRNEFSIHDCEDKDC